MAKSLVYCVPHISLLIGLSAANLIIYDGRRADLNRYPHQHQPTGTGTGNEDPEIQQQIDYKSTKNKVIEPTSLVTTLPAKCGVTLKGGKMKLSFL